MLRILKNRPKRSLKCKTLWSLRVMSKNCSATKWKLLSNTRLKTQFLVAAKLRQFKEVFISKSIASQILNLKQMIFKIIAWLPLLQNRLYNKAPKKATCHLITAWKPFPTKKIQDLNRKRVKVVFLLVLLRESWLYMSMKNKIKIFRERHYKCEYI